MYAYFDVPGGFSDFPIGMTMEQLHAYAEKHIDRTRLEGQEAEQRVLRQVHDASQALAAMRALYAGSTLRLVDDEPSTATLLVLSQPLAYGDSPSLAAEATVRALLGSRGAGWSGRVYELPCGPAAVLTGGRTQPLPEDAVPPDGNRHLPVAELQAFIPVPHHPTLPEPCVLAVNFTTPSLRHWDAYMPPLVRMLRSVEFTTRGEAGSGEPASARDLRGTVEDR